MRGRVHGQQLLASADNVMVRIWDPATGGVERVRKAAPPGCTGCAVQVRSGVLAFPDDDRTVRVWDPATGTTLAGSPQPSSPWLSCHSQPARCSSAWNPASSPSRSTVRVAETERMIIDVRPLTLLKRRAWNHPWCEFRQPRPQGAQTPTACATYPLVDSMIDAGR